MKYRRCSLCGGKLFLRITVASAECPKDDDRIYWILGKNPSKLIWNRANLSNFIATQPKQWTMTAISIWSFDFVFPCTRHRVATLESMSWEFSVQGNYVNFEFSMHSKAYSALTCSLPLSQRTCSRRYTNPNQWQTGYKRSKVWFERKRELINFAREKTLQARAI